MIKLSEMLLLNNGTELLILLLEKSVMANLFQNKKLNTNLPIILIKFMNVSLIQLQVKGSLTIEGLEKSLKG